MQFISKKDNKIDLTINSKDFYEFIKGYLIWDTNKTLSIRLKDKLSNYSNEFLIGFTRGLMDTDGFLNDSNVVCACISIKLMDNLAEIFAKFNIKTSRTVVKGKENKKDLFYVRVLKEGLTEYQNLVGFSNGYKQEKLKNILK